jgi:C1A family cysteine protease
MPATHDGFALGALFDDPDPRDHLYGDYLEKHPGKSLTPPPSGMVTADAKVPILDQGNLGSCTANEAVAHYAIIRVIEGKDPLVLSRLEVYRNARIELGLSTRQDTGATGRACAKVLATIGACPESKWRYDISKFARKPPYSCTSLDSNHNILQYLAIPSGQPDTMAQLKTSLAGGYPVGFSFNVWSNFRPDSNGVIPMPGGEIVGGHRILLVGYDDATQLFKVRNSWGTGWGQGGYCYFHYDHLLQAGEDYWTFRGVE